MVGKLGVLQADDALCVHGCDAREHFAYMRAVCGECDAVPHADAFRCPIRLHINTPRRQRHTYTLRHIQRRARLKLPHPPPQHLEVHRPYEHCPHYNMLLNPPGPSITPRIPHLTLYLKMRPPRTPSRNNRIRFARIPRRGGRSRSTRGRRMWLCRFRACPWGAWPAGSRAWWGRGPRTPASVRERPPLHLLPGGPWVRCAGVCAVSGRASGMGVVVVPLSLPLSRLLSTHQSYINPTQLLEKKIDEFFKVFSVEGVKKNGRESGEGGGFLGGFNPLGSLVWSIPSAVRRLMLSTCSPAPQTHLCGDAQ